MDFKSKLLNDAVEQMSSLPGIGKRSALRLVLHLLDQSEKEVKDFTKAFENLKEHLNFWLIKSMEPSTELLSTTIISPSIPFRAFFTEIKHCSKKCFTL